MFRFYSNLTLLSLQRVLQVEGPAIAQRRGSLRKGPTGGQGDKEDCANLLAVNSSMEIALVVSWLLYWGWGNWVAKQEQQPA